MALPTSPVPNMPTEADERRARHMGARYDLLRDLGDEEIGDWMRSHVSADRLGSWGPPDLAQNPLMDICNQLARPGQYGRTPRVMGGSQELVGPDGALANSGLWTKLQLVQYFALGMGSFVIRPRWIQSKQRFSFRLVSPALMAGWASDEDPSVPVKLWELRVRSFAGESVWAWDQWDISDPENPTYRVVIPRPEGDLDITALIDADLAGSYPYRDVSGAPVLPFVIYRSQDSGDLWNAHHMRGAMWGTLNAMTLSTYAMHAARDASGEMGIMMGMKPPYDITRTADGRTIRTVRSDPGTILVCEPDPGYEGQPVFAKFGAGANLDSIARYAAGYALNLLSRFGVHGEDVQRMSQNPTSGVALHINDKNRRDAQQALAPIFRQSDLETIRVSAVVARSEGGPSWQESGYSVSYVPIPKSPQEQQSDREQELHDLQLGMTSKVRLMMSRNPGMTRDAAVAELEAIALDELDVMSIPDGPEPDSRSERLAALRDMASELGMSVTDAVAE